MNMECHRNLIFRLEAIQHLEKDLEGERNAVSDYQDHRDFLAFGFEGLDDSKIRSAMDKLSEIESEEKHHYAELTELLNTEFFNTLKAVEAFADCECAARGNEVAKSATVSQIKIQGRNPHAR